MTKCLIQETNMNGIKVRIVKDTEWNEFQVMLSIGGVKQDDSTYHTDDKQDAIDTAQFIIDKYVKEFA